MDAVLDWMHGNVRAGAAKLIFFRVLQPRAGHDSPAGQVLGKSAAITLRQALKVRTCLRRDTRRFAALAVTRQA